MLFDRVLPPFRDEEDDVLTIIEAYFVSLSRDVTVGNETPETDLREALPFVRVSRVGGAARAGEEHTDRPVVDVDVLAGTRREAKEIAQLVEQLLLSRPHPIDSCNVLMGPQQVNWVSDNPVRRFYASYQLGLRR